MKTPSIFTTLLVAFLGWMAISVQFKYYKLQKDKDRITANYQAQIDSVHTVLRDSIKMYQSTPQTFTQDEFKELFAAELEKIRILGLKKPSTAINTTAITTHHITTTARDTVIIDTIPAKTWSYQTTSLSITGLEVGDKRQVTYTHKLSIAIYKSLKPRVGFWNKVFLRPIKRKPLVSVIPSDSSTKFVEIKYYDIKN